MSNAADFLKNFYSGKRVLVTGHTGFKGSWLSLWLLELGAHVIGYALDPEEEHCLFQAAKLHERMVDIRGNICDLDSFRSAITTHRPEVIFHMAAQPLVRASYDDPLETFQTNVLGTVHLLEVLRQVDFVRSCLVITTDKVYENVSKQGGYVEEDPLGGEDPYSASKACTELATLSYLSSFFDKKLLATVRAGNVLGGGDWSKDRLVPDFYRSKESGEDLALRYPDAVRPWQHVLDPLYGYLLLAARLSQDGSYSGAWNFGPNPDHTRKVIDLVQALSKVSGELAHSSQVRDPSKKEELYLTLDSTKAIKELGWRSLLDFTQVMNYVSEWYDGYHAQDPYELTLGQLRRYMELLTHEELI